MPTDTEFLQAAAGIAIVAFFLLIIFKIGAKNVMAVILASINRLYHGPGHFYVPGYAPVKPQTQLCKNLHDTALIEIEVYDRVLSTSVLQHLEHCRYREVELTKYLLEEKKADAERNIHNIQAREMLLKGGAMKPQGAIQPPKVKDIPIQRERKESKPLES